MLAEVDELRSDFTPNLTIDILGEADSSGLGDAFEASGDIDTVAEQIIPLDYDIADIDSDAEVHPLLWRQFGVQGSDTALHRDRAAHRVYRAREFHQYTVAGCLHDAAVMIADRGID